MKVYLRDIEHMGGLFVRKDLYKKIRLTKFYRGRLYLDDTAFPVVVGTHPLEGDYLHCFNVPSMEEDQVMRELFGKKYTDNIKRNTNNATLYMQIRVLVRCLVYIFVGYFILKAVFCGINAYYSGFFLSVSEICRIIVPLLLALLCKVWVYMSCQSRKGV